MGWGTKKGGKKIRSSFIIIVDIYVSQAIPLQIERQPFLIYGFGHYRLTHDKGHKLWKQSKKLSITRVGVFDSRNRGYVSVYLYKKVETKCAQLQTQKNYQPLILQCVKTVLKLQELVRTCAHTRTFFQCSTGIDWTF